MIRCRLSATKVPRFAFRRKPPFSVWSMNPKKKSGTEKPQVEKFRDLARELECDDDEQAFDERLKKLATATAAKKQRIPKDQG